MPANSNAFCAVACSLNVVESVGVYNVSPCFKVLELNPVGVDIKVLSVVVKIPTLVPSRYNPNTFAVVLSDNVSLSTLNPDMPSAVLYIGPIRSQSVPSYMYS